MRRTLRGGGGRIRRRLAQSIERMSVLRFIIKMPLIAGATHDDDAQWWPRRSRGVSAKKIDILTELSASMNEASVEMSIGL